MNQSTARQYWDSMWYNILVRIANLLDTRCYRSSHKVQFFPRIALNIRNNLHVAHIRGTLTLDWQQMFGTEPGKIFWNILWGIYVFIVLQQRYLMKIAPRHMTSGLGVYVLCATNTRTTPVSWDHVTRSHQMLSYYQRFLFTKKTIERQLITLGANA